MNEDHEIVKWLEHCLVHSVHSVSVGIIIVHNNSNSNNMNSNNSNNINDNSTRYCNRYTYCVKMYIREGAQKYPLSSFLIY